MKRWLWLILFCFTPIGLFAQVEELISPGELSKAHARFSGVKNCNVCHGGHKEVLEQKCLDCHKELAARISANRGFHADKKTACMTCHTEHLGKEFDIRGLDVKNFNHEETGWKLEGLHASIKNCAACHKTRSFLGLSTTCESCHKDPHRGALPKCETCHSVERPMKQVTFDHNTTKFPLIGAHQKVPCLTCHKNQVFKGLRFTNCTSCHIDPHKSTLGTNCLKCHNNDAWKNVAVSHTKFPLVGKHKTVPCQKCHVGGKWKIEVYAKCADCHKDPHLGQFLKRACDECHTVEGFQPARVNHDKFKLENGHAIPCAKCHKLEKFPAGASAIRYKPMRTDCVACHTDVHGGQFGQKCEQCHSNVSFKFKAFDHSKTRYPLDSKHVSVPCAKCHVKDKTTGIVRYKPLATNCAACHKDPHLGQFAPKQCEQCHSQQGVQVNHSETRFPLQGKHRDVPCSKCHLVEKGKFPEGVGETIRYKPISTDCKSCHEDYHRGQFIEDCVKCHTADGFKPTIFDHAKSEFVLSGQHLKVMCERCHKQEVFAIPPPQVTRARFKPVAKECSRCHEDPHKGQFGTNCVNCHSTDKWQTDAKLFHRMGSFILDGRHLTVQCQSCHLKSVYKGTPVSCYDCHWIRRQDDVNRLQLGTACEKCHQTSDWSKTQYNHFGETGVRLNAAHLTLRCSNCHVNRVYNQVNCYNCHQKDYESTTRPNHRAAGFPITCEGCHNAGDQTWESGLNHNEFFPLSGRHASAPCTACHVNGVYQGTQRTCYGCHRTDYDQTRNPNHKNAGFATTCDNCHKFTDPDWHQTKFNHQSFFPLVGRHTTADCSACHVNNVYKGTPRDCYGCHRPDYDSTQNPNHRQSGFSTNCETCHKATDSSWGSGSGFNHNSVFPLVGRHATASCVSCHQNGVYKGTPRECYGCHRKDYDSTQNPNHRQSGFSTNCESCHKPTDTNWRSGTGFNHNSVFPLSGRHSTASCDSCHKNGVYKGTPKDCYGCHRRDYDSTRNPNHRQSGFSTNCDSCHKFSDPDWNRANFNHNDFFRLSGRHASASCASCHRNGVYKGTPTDCYGCHRPDYDSTRNPNHRQAGFPTNCDACHQFADPDWNRANFNHNQFFPLAGRHASATCESCHRGGVYRGTPKDCYGCHRNDYESTRNPDHRAAGFPTACDNCHRFQDSTWNQGRFDHRFPITSGKHAGNPCSACHTNPGNYQVFTCLTCHTRGETDGHHDDVGGYRYESNACYACHPDGRAEDD